MELLTLSPTSANQNLTNFLSSALPEKEDLGQPVSTCQLSTSYLTQLEFPFTPYKEGSPALTNQGMPSIIPCSF